MRNQNLSLPAAWRLLLCMLVAMVLTIAVKLPVQAQDAEGSTDGYFKEQLDDTARVFYDAMQSVYEEGSMKTGKGGVEITNLLPEGTLQDYVVNGKDTLPKAFQAARDAFIHDHVDLFYVDSSKLTLRVGRETNGSLVAYINNGSNANYYAQGYSSQADVEDALGRAAAVKAEIVNAVKTHTVEQNGKTTVVENSIADMITEVHKELIKRIVYTYPSDSERNVSGIYGALVEGKANCEGYSRSFKWIMDELGIPCVLVSGAGTNSKGVTEYHMWNYVKLDEQWFAVDVTWDDPITDTRETDIKVTYLLAGSDTLDSNHFAQGMFSNGSKTFIYPELCQMDYSIYLGSDIEQLEGSLQVSAKKIVMDNMTNTLFSIYYADESGKYLSLSEIEKKGLHLAARFSSSDSDGVFAPWVDLGDYSIDTKTSPIQLPIWKEGTIQLCVTTETRPKDSLTYTKDLSPEGNNIAITKVLHIPYFDTYVVPPFVRTASPALTARILPEPQHYRIEYDELLVKADEDKEIGIDVTTTQPHLQYAITNVVKEEGAYTLPNGTVRQSTIISFDFVPDATYQGANNTYTLQPTNLIGVDSKKVPNSFPIVTGFKSKIPCPIFASQGGDRDAFVIAYPKMIADDKLDIFMDAEGRPANALDIRLVASIPNSAEADKMLDALDNKEQILSSTSYDLVLNCKNELAALKSADYHLTIGVPYPEGYNYLDNNQVTFKAYHYIKQADGTYKTEELACRITEKGLEVIAESFSPFTIVALPKEEEDNKYKLVSITSDTAGGSVTTKDVNNDDIIACGLYKLDAQNNSRTFSVAAEEGYQIDKLLIDGAEVTEASGKSSFDKAFTFGNLKSRAVSNADEQANTLKVSFIAKSVVAEETYTPITPEVVIEIPVLTGLTASEKGFRKVYTEGDVFDKTGLVVTGVYSDGSERELENYSVTGTPLTTGDTSVEVSFTKDNQSFKATIDGIVVKERPTQKTLTGVRVKNSIVKYKTGEIFKSDGDNFVVEAAYLNGEKEILTEDQYTLEIVSVVGGAESTHDPAAALSENDKKALVTYTEGGVTRTTFVELTVNPELQSLKITGTPSQTKYYVGDKFNPTGLTVSAVYGGSTAILGYTDYKITPEILTEGLTEVTFSYTEGGITKTAKYSGITVVKDSVKSISVKSGPTQTAYFDGDIFQPAGLVITAVYDSGVTKDIESGFQVDISSKDSSGGLTKASKVTVIYDGKQTEVTAVTVDGLAGISVETLPSKTEYFIGEVFTPDGLVVKAAYDSDATRVVPSDKYTITVSNKDAEGGMTLTSEVTVRYRDKDVKITGLIVKENHVAGISIKNGPAKTEYFVGEMFNSQGIVLQVSYDNGEEEEIASQFVCEASNQTENGGLSKNSVVTVTYGGKSVNLVGIVIKDDLPLSIQVKTPPAKLTYNVGEVFDAEGLVIEAAYESGAVKNISSENYAITVTNTDTEGGLTLDSKVTISYIGAEIAPVEVTGITINAVEDAVTSIRIATPPAKKSYFVGDSFESAGLVVEAVRESGAFEMISSDDYSIDITELDAEGGLTRSSVITVVYGEFSVILQGITIHDNDVTGIVLKTPPLKMQYYAGEIFEPAGLVVTASYANGTNADVSAEACKITVSNVDGNGGLTETSKVSVTFGGKSLELNGITISKNNVNHIVVKQNPLKMTYFVGDKFNAAGLLLTVIYDNGTDVEVTSAQCEYAVSNLDANGGLTKESEVTVMFGGKSAILEGLVVRDNTVSSVEIKNAPDKMTYFVGDKFDAAGLVLKVRYADGETEEIQADQCDITVSKSDANGGLTEASTVTVGYGGKSTELKGLIVNAVSISDITMTQGPDKTEYFVGEVFDPAGMILTVTYNNGQTETVKADQCEIVVSNLNENGGMTLESAVTVKYGDFTAVLEEVIVHENSVTEIVLIQEPLKTEYVVGDKFDPAGITVKVYYANQTSEEVPVDQCQVIISNLDANGGLTKESAVTISYAGHEIGLKNIVVKDKAADPKPEPKPEPKPSPDNSGSGTQVKASEKAVKTGDTTNVLLYMLLVGAGIGTVIAKKRKEAEK